MATLWRREMVRFFRQRNRILGALGTPLLFWIVLGSGLSASFIPAGMKDTNYLVYFFPGTIALVVLFTSVFSTFSVIEDRQRGFLQGVLVSPAPRLSVVLGNILGGTTVGFVQGMLMVVLAPFLGIPQTAASLTVTALSIFLLSFALTSLGFTFAWRMDSTQGFHSIMNLLLFPLWMVSGAVFPVKEAPSWLVVIMKINPVTYCVTSLREGLNGHLDPALAVAALFALVTLTASVWTVGGRS
jgi:ABC-2 type transport system permease protein